MARPGNGVGEYKAQARLDSKPHLAIGVQAGICRRVSFPSLVAFRNCAVHGLDSPPKGAGSKQTSETHVVAEEVVQQRAAKPTLSGLPDTC